MPAYAIHRRPPRTMTELDQAKLQPGDIVLMSSPGGNLSQSMIMGEVIRARELRTLLADDARSWRAWRRLWRRLMYYARPLEPQPPARPLVRVCMYCARVYVALPLARGIDEDDRAWDTVPRWVREQFGTPALRVIPSHGMCPTCGRQYLPHF